MSIWIIVVSVIVGVFLCDVDVFSFLDGLRVFVESMVRNYSLKTLKE